MERFFLTGIILLSLGGCKVHPERNMHAGVSEDSNLTQVEAASRGARLGKISYDISTTLNEKDSSFRGRSDIRFELRDPSGPLRVDFHEGEIQSLVLNGKPLESSVKHRYWIELPAPALVNGENRLIIVYTHKFATDGKGLHRFVDPENGDVFLYSQFEAFDANRFMPCFDQPDLKATFKLTVEAPKNWTVVSATIEHTKKVDGTRSVWEFPASAPISTYLFSLHAGPFKIWMDKFEGLPLRLLVRPALAKYVNVTEWFKITKQGLKFFNTYYQFAYPFKKYDQLIVPEFNAGAMENVGAVTFSENFVTRAQPTRAQRRSVAGVILHEMAHMWFGNLVTMSWWNDLWLNESFATYMANLALFEATEFRESWLEFFAGTKQWAYWQDRLITSHPIEGVVPSVKDASASFDGITYGKGAAVLKQLRSYIGDTSFRKGIADYIQAYAYKNATRSDFITSLQEHTRHDLSSWSKLWLRQSHTDILTSDWRCRDGKLSELTTVVTPFAEKSFRPQFLRVAQLAELNGKMKVTHQEPVTQFRETQMMATTATGCPAFVYPNYEDHAFAVVKIDRQSLEVVKEKLSFVEDDLLRSQLWWNIWEMVLYRELPLTDYVAIVKAHLPVEKNVTILREVLKTLTGRGRGTVLYHWPAKLKDPGLTEFTAWLENLFLLRIKESRAGSDLQKLWFDHYVEIAKSPASLGRIHLWLTNGTQKLGMPLDIDRQWALVQQLARFDHRESTDQLKILMKKDDSDRGRKRALAAQAIFPLGDVKKNFVAAILPYESDLSYQDVNAIASSLFPLEQADLLKPYEETFYTFLDQNKASEDEGHTVAVLNALNPLRCEGAASDRLKKFLTNLKDVLPGITKNLLTRIDDDERCQAIRAMIAQKRS